MDEFISILEQLEEMYHSNETFKNPSKASELIIRAQRIARKSSYDLKIRYNLIQLRLYLNFDDALFLLDSRTRDLKCIENIYIYL